LATAVVAVAIGGALGETAVRILHPEATRRSIFARLDSTRFALAATFRPDPELHHVGGDLYHLTFPDPSDSPRDRLMLVGDSFVMGGEVGRERRFGGLLQAHFGSRIAVDVFGVTSYAPIIYRNIVRKALSLARYRAVAVFVDQTDPADDTVYQGDLRDDDTWLFDVAHLTARARRVDEWASSTRDRFSGRFNPRRLAIVNFLDPPSLLADFQPTDRDFQYVRQNVTGHLYNTFLREPEKRDSQTMLALIFKHLDQIVALCQSQGVPLFLVANPWEMQSSRRPRLAGWLKSSVEGIVPLSGPYPKENYLEAALERRYGTRPGVHVIALTRIFRESPDPDALFVAIPDSQIHWNENGHELVERALRETLVRTLPNPFAGG
jgi:hypothetical protein